jgi:predicted Zn-dependent protease
MYKKTILELLILGVMLLCRVCPLQAQQKAEEDALLQILNAELNRNYQALYAADPLVYQITYRVEETDSYDISASFGTLLASENQFSRTLYVEVRVGDYALDNFHELRNHASEYFRMSPSVINLSYGEDMSALKQILWRETEKKYREAIQRYELLKANVAVKREADDKAPDYSGNPYTTYYEPPQIIDFDTPYWESVLKQISAQFVEEQDITTGNSSLHFLTTRKYFVSSDQSYTVQNNSYCYLYISVDGQSEDGMNLPLYKSYFRYYPQELPESYHLTEDAEKLRTTFTALKKAPVVEAYEGPAILSKEAAGVFFHEIFGHRVEGLRMKSEKDAQTFKKQVGEQILNPDITVMFDPTVGNYSGVPLNGTYKYDDEGVKAEKVMVVERGVLRNFLMTRTPIDNFPQSNGHARAQSGYRPVSRQSNLIVQTAHPYSDDQLRQMLIREIKEQGKPYGYYFASVEGGFTLTGRTIPNSFNVLPLEVYRVYADGRPDELVRGVDLVGTPLAMFSKIEALGAQWGSFAGICRAESGSVPVGCCSPAVLIKQIELQKKSRRQDIKPLITRPAGVDDASEQEDFVQAAFRAMEDEMVENFEQLHLPGMQAPYFISYRITDAVASVATASLGATIRSFQKPLRTQKTEILAGNNQLNNTHFQNFNSYSRYNSKIAIENSYWNIRRSLWKSADNAYKAAAENYENKVSAIAQQNLPAELVSLPDRAMPSPTEYVKENEAFKPVISNLENMAQVVSVVFKEYPNITNTGAMVYQYRADVLYLNSEKTQYQQPFNLAGIKVFAETSAPDGEPLTDCFTLYAPAPEQLPDLPELIERAHAMARQLETLRTASPVEEIYSGPVLFTDEAVAEMVAHAFIDNPSGILAARTSITANDRQRSNASQDNKTERLMNKKVIAGTLSLTALDRLTHYQGVPLIGSYQMDAEGVEPPAQLPIIKEGVLQTLLSDCTPTRSTKTSNGHRRLALSGGAITTSLCAGVLELSGNKKESYNKLKKRLLALAKEEDYEYAYIIRKVANNNSGTAGATPVYVYQVSVKDGSEKPVRMVKMSDLTLKDFKQVEGISNEQQAVNMLLKGKPENRLYGNRDMPMYGVPCSLIVPKAILFKELELEKEQNITLKKMPVVPNPIQ